MMARRMVSPGAVVGVGLGEWLSEEKVPAKPRTKQLSEYDAALQDAETRAKTGAWADARAASFVGLYAFCHRRLYGVDPAELRNKTDFRAAARMASQMLARFESDGPAFAAFIVWTWERQARRDEYFKKRSEMNGDRAETFRIGYRLQFSAKIETDYRVEMASNRKARRG